MCGGPVRHLHACAEVASTLEKDHRELQDRRKVAGISAEAIHSVCNGYCDALCRRHSWTWRMQSRLPARRS